MKKGSDGSVNSKQGLSRGGDAVQLDRWFASRSGPLRYASLGLPSRATSIPSLLILPIFPKTSSKCHSHLRKTRSRPEEVANLDGEAGALATTSFTGVLFTRLLVLPHGVRLGRLGHVYGRFSNSLNTSTLFLPFWYCWMAIRAIRASA